MPEINANSSMSPFTVDLKMELSQEGLRISSDPDTKGFDLSAGVNWIYPLNYPLREYQYSITQNALFSNTLVCLPTGLGKTLIAAVVMYNFWRWYPRGKIVFLAPTKPLVAQQISACHDIMGIPSSDTIELTGSMNPKNRQIAWFTKRVIFATPQVFQNDLDKQIAPGDLVRCVVIDEAHKALGKHAYCESLRLLRTQNACFRVLALSATPGSRVEDVCQVIQNLSISNLELRDETSPDIKPYLNDRQMDIILVQLDADLARFKEKYVAIIDHYVRLLIQYNVLKGNASTLGKGRIFYLYKEFQTKTNKSANHGQIMKILCRCMSLYHAYDLLIRHGLRAFTAFCQTHSTDVWITQEPTLQELLVEIQSFLGPFPDVRPLPDGTIEEIPKDLVFGHTKFCKLKNILLEHFNKFAMKNEETRAIVFVEYRDSVSEVYVALLQLRPMLRPKMFVGQAGQKQKQQMQTMEAFRNNEANVLISTSVGEEGLDVGEVDLIVCFDVSQSSPIRLVQRMGRTGRRRDGRIVMLVTDGKEHQSLKSTIAKRDSLNKKVLHSSSVISSMFQESPRMVPADLKPVCNKMHIVLQAKTPKATNKRKRNEKNDNVRPVIKRATTTAKNDAVLQVQTDKKKSSQDKGKTSPEKGRSTQLLMLRFFKKPETNGSTQQNAADVTQLMPANHHSKKNISQTDSVKLYTSDTVAVEFLTSCAIKASKLEQSYDKLNRMVATCLDPSTDDRMEDFFHNLVPSLDVLECIAFLEEPMEDQTLEETEYLDFDREHSYIGAMAHNQVNNFEYSNIDNSPAAGERRFEDLLDDSCGSDETMILNNDQQTISNSSLLDVLKIDNEHQSYDMLIAPADEVIHNKDHNSHTSLPVQNFHDEPGTFERLLDELSDDDDQQSEEQNNLSTKECFESILDESSDSEVPPSQGEEEFQLRTHKYWGGSRRDDSSKNSNEILGSTRRISESSTGQFHGPKFQSEKDQIQRTGVATDHGISRSVNFGKLRHANDTNPSSVCDADDKCIRLDVDLNRDSPFFVLKNEDCVSPSISIHHKSTAPVAVTKAVNVSTSQINCDEKSVTKHFIESMDEDDDVFFLAEISTPRHTASRKQLQDENWGGKNDISFKQKVTKSEFIDANESNADSSASTITQILELLDRSNPPVKRVNLKQLSNMDKIQRDSTAAVSQTKKPDSENVAMDKSNHTNILVSHYFSQKSNDVNNMRSLEAPQPQLDDLDLSDLKWDDDFGEDPKRSDCTVVADQINKQSNEQSLAVKHGQSINDGKSPKLLSQNESSSKTDADRSPIFAQSNRRIQKSSAKTSLDSDFDNSEWEKDFISPRNPVEKFEQSKPPASLGMSIKKQLDSRKSETLEPGTSRGYSDDDSDFEEDIFRGIDSKRKVRKNRDFNINHMLPNHEKVARPKRQVYSSRSRENADPNLRLSCSAGRNVADGRKVSAPDRCSANGKNFRVRNRMKSSFLDDEAEILSDTSSGTSGTDDDLDGFISHTQPSPEKTDMKKHYLQSIQEVHTGGFHFRLPECVIPYEDVFSQPMEKENSTYLNDSFCVSSGEEDGLIESDEITILESNERVLNGKKRRHLTNGKIPLTKKRKLTGKSSDSSSSEDETEKLRKQILEESMILNRRIN